MKRQDPETLLFYDKEVIKLMMEKYDINQIEGLRSFTKSETHRMLEDLKYDLTEFGPEGIFNIWEAEKITGDPRNSAYIRED